MTAVRLGGPLPRVQAAIGPLRRVLYVTDLDPSLRFGSLEEQILTLARAFRERGGTFLPVFQEALAGRTRQEFSRAEIRAEALDLRRFHPGVLARLLRLARENRIDLVHWNFYHPLNPYVLGLSILAPYLSHILTDHNSRAVPEATRTIPPHTFWPRRLMKRLLLRRYRRAIGISEFVRQCLEEQGVWRNVSSCLYFVNTARFAPRPETRAVMRRDLLAGDRFVVLLVAQLIKAKGVDVLLRALTRLPDHVVTWVVGDGEEGDRLRCLARELGVTRRVRFFGYQADVSDFMQGADCLVVPSLWQEAVGLVVLEGMSTGLPVIGSAVGGIPEFIDDGRAGFLVEAGNVSQLAERIGQLASDPDLRTRLGLAARTAALARFAPERRLGDHLSLYEAIT